LVFLVSSAVFSAGGNKKAQEAYECPLNKKDEYLGVVLEWQIKSEVRNG